MSGAGKDNCGDREIHFTVSAPGKLILFGEHSVVYGKSALAACINKRTNLKFSEIKDVSKKLVTIKMKEINLDISLQYEDIISIINEDIPRLDNNPICNVVNPLNINYDKYISIIEGYIKKYAGEDLPKQQQMSLTVFFYILHGLFYKANCYEEDCTAIQPFVIDISSELSVGAGTGSSASFCVCIAAALYYYKNINKYRLRKVKFDEEDLELLSKWAFSGEKILHGKPSGIDNTVATFGSFVAVNAKKDPVTNELVRSFKKLHNPPKINVLLINTGVLRNTLHMVEKVVGLKTRLPIIVDHILDGMDEICLKATEIINALGKAEFDQSPGPDFCHLETLVDANQGLLYALGVSHERLQEICLICSRHKLHAKLTGAGGGGYAFALVPPNFHENELSSCMSELKRSGYDAYTTELGSDGVKVEEKLLFQ